MYIKPDSTVAISDELQAQLWIPQKLHGLFAMVYMKACKMFRNDNLKSCPEVRETNLALKRCCFWCWLLKLFLRWEMETSGGKLTVTKAEV